jgi:hypothetical protein
MSASTSPNGNAAIARDSPEEPIVERLDAGAPTPREYLEEENREHLAQHRDGSSASPLPERGHLDVRRVCTPALPPETLRVPTLLVMPETSGSREEQLDAYRRALGDGLQVVEVVGSTSSTGTPTRRPPTRSRRF